MDSQKIIHLAIAILVLVILVGGVFALVNTGSSLFKSSNEAMNSALDDMKTTKYDIYDNTSVNGETVINLINSSWLDQNIEVCVSTKDGGWFAYNQLAHTGTDGKVAPRRIVQSQLRNAPKAGATDRNGKTFLINKDPFYASGPKTSDGKVTGLDWSTPTTIATEDGVTGYSCNNAGSVDNTNAPTGSSNIATIFPSGGEPLTTADGYNMGITNRSTVGYISKSAKFNGSVQRDDNNNVRRVTFIQQ